MRDPRHEPTATADEAAPAPSGDAVPPRGGLDVPEWVSELRRLYVEPKTRAELRRKGVIGSQKRRRGAAAVGRGARASDEAASPVDALTTPLAAGAEVPGSGAAGQGIATIALAGPATIALAGPAASAGATSSSAGPSRDRDAEVATRSPAVADEAHRPLDPPATKTSDEAAAEPAPVARPAGTVPPVTLSWREAGSLELGVPEVDGSDGAIVVEPPSQLVAERRNRRREPDADDLDEVEPESGPWAEETASVLPEHHPVPLTRASLRAASGYRSGKRRRAVVIGFVLVLLGILAWYFLLRGDGGAASAAPGASAAIVLARCPRRGHA